jgi:hypothetical protein
MAAWAIMWVRAGHPASAFLGQPPGGRERVVSYTAGGWGYLLDFTFAVNMAAIVYVYLHPSRSLWAPPVLALLALSFVADSLLGSRLLLVMSVISLLFLRLLPRAGTDPRTQRWANRRAAKRLVAAGVLLFLAASSYTSYRTGGGLGEQFRFNAPNTFDTAATYYQVLDKVPSKIPYWNGKSLTAPFLFRVPTKLAPGKYGKLWDNSRFTQEFYGYDQRLSGTVARGEDLLAEAWLNGGLVAVLIAMLALGYFNDRLARRGRDPASSGFFKVAYVVYVLFFIPVAHKAGLVAAITYVDVKLGLLWVAILLTRQGLRGAAGPQQPVAVSGRR